MDAAPDAAEAVLSVLGNTEEQQSAAVVTPKKANGRKRQAATEATAVDAVNAAVAAVTAEAGARKAPKRQRIKATELAVKTETELVEPAEKGIAMCKVMCCTAVKCALQHDRLLYALLPTHASM